MPRQIDLLPEDSGVNRYPNQELLELMNLLQQTSSLSVVSDILKNKNLTFSSSSWDHFLQKRISPALNRGDIQISELYALLSRVEEYGRNHIFLYRCSREDCQRLLDSARVESALNNNSLDHLKLGPVLLNQPESPTISEFRWDSELRGNCLTLKIIETRRKKIYAGESWDGNRLTRSWDVEKVRAVNTARLFESGILEVKLQSNHNSTNYRDDLRRIWNGLLIDFFPPSRFGMLSLREVKNDIFLNREAYREEIRYSDVVLRNRVGTVLQAATGSEVDDLLDDAGALESTMSFIGSRGAYCEGTNIWWKKKEDGLPNKDIHVLLSGELNEFAIPANCSKEDYEYILDQFLRLAQR